MQPFRYRGYVFDEETGLYYLRSRYYGSEWCRFINSDSILTLNLFCYCNNQPINNADSNGMLTTSAFAFKCIDDSSSVYLSPSQRAPEAVLTEGLHGKNTGNIPVAYLLAYLDQMVASGRWAYRANTMLWEKVDCVAMIRTAFQQYSQKLAAQTPTTVGGTVPSAFFVWATSPNATQGIKNSRHNIHIVIITFLLCIFAPFNNQRLLNTSNTDLYSMASVLQYRSMTSQ